VWGVGGRDEIYPIKGKRFAHLFGAEVGISTNRLHARGPMGLRELTTYKYVIYGNGQVRE